METTLEERTTERTSTDSQGRATTAGGESRRTESTGEKPTKNQESAINPNKSVQKVSEYQKRNDTDPFRLVFTLKYGVTMGQNNIPKYTKELRQEMVNDYHMVNALFQLLTPPESLTPEQFCDKVQGTPKVNTFTGWLEKYPATVSQCKKLSDKIEALESLIATLTK